jgi:hypothetical protein
MTMSSRARLRRGNRPSSLPRDTDPTVFTTLLSDLIGRIPGARAAALVDRDGESIDYAGVMSPFDVKVAAAHWQIVLAQLTQVALLRDARQVVVRGATKSYLLRSLADAYAVVVILSRGGGFSPTVRAFSAFERALYAEAGIGSRQRGRDWTPVVVEFDARRRPLHVASAQGAPRQTVEVLGAVMGLGRGERGFRVRLSSGVETTVVREASGACYTDESIEQSPGGGVARP